MNPMEALMPTHAAITKTPALRIAVVHEDPAWTFDVLVARVVDFQNRKFPGQTLAGVLKHLEREVGELRENPADEKEWADVLILLIAALYRRGITTDELFAIAHAKVDENETRTWPVQPDADGVYHHVEEGK
jgi:hypothetical protein